MLDIVLASGGGLGSSNDMLIITACCILLIVILQTGPYVVRGIRNFHWKKKKVEI
jgi:hypothetical protein